MNAVKSLGLLLALVASPGFTLSFDTYPAARQFVGQLARRHGIDPQVLTAALRDAEIKTTILRAMRRPAEGKPWPEYRKIFLTRKRIDQGVAFWKRHRALLERVQRTYGVPAQILVAILGVETFYGTRTGSFRVLDALATLAFAYPRRADFFRRELEQFFLLTREEGMDPRRPLGSYAGAMGWPQFMPSSYRRYATDFDGDGKRDIWNNPADVIASIANYFVEHGWQKDEPVAAPLPKVAIALADTDLQPRRTLAELKAQGLSGLDLPYPDSRKAVVMVFDGDGEPEAWLGFPNFYVITRYNHSRLYAMAVYQLSEAIRSRVGAP